MWGGALDQGKFIDIEDGKINVNLKKLLLAMINLPSDDVPATDFDIDFEALRSTVLKGMTFTGTSIDGKYSHLTALRHVSGPEVISIGEDAFKNNSVDAPGINTIDFPKVTSISDGAFEGHPITSLNIPNARTIGERAFSGAKITTLYLPNVQIISASAFSGDPITSLNLPNARTIGSGAFSDTQLVSVYLPNAQNIDKNAFYNSYNITMFYAPKLDEFLGSFEHLEHLATSYHIVDRDNTELHYNLTWYVEPENVEKAKEYVAANYASGNITVKPFSEFPFPESHQ